MTTNHFTDKERKCPCGECDGGEMNKEFMFKLEALRTYLDFPFPVSSGYRCKKYNAKKGGVKNSYHLLGRAVDIAVDHNKAYMIVSMAKRFGFYGVGVNQKGDKRFIHIDDRLPRQNTDVTFFSY